MAKFLMEDCFSTLVQCYFIVSSSESVLFSNSDSHFTLILFCTLHQSIYSAHQLALPTSLLYSPPCSAHKLVLPTGLLCSPACSIQHLALSTNFLCLPALFIHVIFSTLKFWLKITVWKSYHLSLLILYYFLFFIPNRKFQSENKTCPDPLCLTAKDG